MKKGILTPIVTACLIAAATPAEQTLRVGASDAFENRVNLLINHRGHADAPELRLRQARPIAYPGEIDLYLDFDDGIGDAAGNYEVVENSAVHSRDERAWGTGGAGFLYKESRIALRPRSGYSLFAGREPWRDFSIGFWLYAASLDEGESVFRWKAGRSGAQPELQELSFTFSAKRGVWLLKNLFDGPAVIRLSGRHNLLPRTWQHHLLRYDDDTGLVEYLIDGVPEAVVHASVTGREDGTRFNLLPGRGGEIVLGEGFEGLLDEFIIRRDFSEPLLVRYEAEGGSAESRVLDLGTSNAGLLRINAVFRQPAETAVFLYFKQANTREGLMNQEWIPALPNRDLSDPGRGRFVALRLELFPDGSGSETPTVSSIELVYEPNPPPPPPSRVIAAPGDGSISLRWTPVHDPDVDGYRIYWGSRSGRYDGTHPVHGESPILIRNRSVTSFVFDGLSNGTLYFFAVAAFDEDEDPLAHPLSTEVSARPSRIHR